MLAYTYNHQLGFPPCCDVGDYQGIAKHYAANGIFSYHDHAHVRLYGFPLILSFFYGVFGAENATLFYAIFNSIAYITLSIFLARELRAYVKNYQFLHIAFSMNIFLFPYLTIPLADGISVVFWMLIFYLILKVLSKPRKVISFVLLFFCSFAIGVSVMIRPSNITLIILLPALFGMLYLMEQKLNKITVAILLIFGFLLAILPQLYSNYLFFQKITFLPVVDLGNAQIKWGIENIKYATNLSGEGVPQLFYKNPFYVQIDNLKLSWYFLNLENGIKTILLHIFNAFSYDYYFPYIYDLHPKYKSSLLVYSWFVMYFGVLGVVEVYKILWSSGKECLNNVKILMYLIFPAVFLGALSILMLSAVENRFSLPLVLVMTAFAFYSFFKNFKRIIIWLVFSLWISCASLIQSFVDLQKNIPSV